ncbi:MAG: alpha/beta hydrolase [Prosthecobacter sp.]
MLSTLRHFLLPLVFILGANSIFAQRANPEGPALRRALPDTVKVERDIVYATYGDRKVILDLYLPKSPASEKIPCIVVIHGGGWRMGDKTKFAAQAAYLADQGFAAACIGYRLLPEVTFPAPIVDCKAAVRWVRANAVKYGIDPDSIGATGGSAGGHLTAMLASSYKVAALEGEGGNPGVSSRIQAAVAMAAPGDMSAYAQRTGADAELAALISPMTHIDKESAPMLLIHSTNDRTVPIAHSEGMLAKYKELGLTGDLVKIENGGHAFWNSPQWFGEVMEKTAAFFKEQLRK